MNLSLQTDKYIGKRGLVKIPDRDNFGRIVLGRWVEVGGIINYLGPNPFLNIPLMVLIDRTPYTINNLNDIRLL